MRWRNEGEAVEGDDEEEGEGVVDLRDVIEEQEEFERYAFILQWREHHSSSSRGSK